MADYTRSNLDVLGPGTDVVTKAHTAVRQQADGTVLVADALVVTFNGHEIHTHPDTATTLLGDTVVKVHTAVRTQADALLGTAAGDAATRAHTAVRTQDDGTTALTDTLDLLEYMGRARADTADVTLGPGDAAARTVTSVRSQADTLTGVADSTVKVHAAVRTQADVGPAGPTAADAVVESDGYGRVQNDVLLGAGSVDTHSRAVGWQRSNADGVAAADAGHMVSHDFTHHDYVGAPSGYGYSHGAVDVAFRTVTSVRTQADAAVAVAGDALSVEIRVRPRNVYVRHVYPGPSLVVQHRDWERGGVAYNRAGDNTLMPLLTLRRGLENTILASNIGDWQGTGKDYLATMVAKGQARFYEDYLARTVRQLGASQVAFYVGRNAPWITWVQHKALVGAPVANEAAPGATHGLQAMDWNQLRVKVLFTGGLAPLCKITAWHRDILPTSKGPWTEGQTEVNVQHRAEFTIANTYREVWLQVHTLSGAPTGATVMVSGC